MIEHENKICIWKRQLFAKEQQHCFLFSTHVSEASVFQAKTSTFANSVIHSYPEAICGEQRSVGRCLFTQNLVTKQNFFFPWTPSVFLRSQWSHLMHTKEVTLMVSAEQKPQWVHMNPPQIHLQGQTSCGEDEQFVNTSWKAEACDFLHTLVLITLYFRAANGNRIPFFSISIDVTNNEWMNSAQGTWEEW